MTILAHCLVVNSILYGGTLSAIALYGDLHAKGNIDLLLAGTGAAVGFLLSWFMAPCYIWVEKCDFWKTFFLWITAISNPHNKDMRNAMLVALSILLPVLLCMAYALKKISY